VDGIQTPNPTPPTITPLRWPFLIGSIGHFLAAGVSIPYGVMALLFVPFPGVLAGWWYLSVLLSMGLLLQSFTFYGIWRGYRSRIGAYSFGAGFVAALSFLVLGFAARLACDVSTWYCYRTAGFGLDFFILSIVLLGIASILEGLAIWTIRGFTEVPHDAFAASVMYCIAGAFFLSIALAFFGGFFALAAALIAGGVVLRKAPVFPAVAAPAPTLRPA